MRTAVLISGRGSNMMALMAASRKSDAGFDISLVISNRAEAKGLAYAEARGVETATIDHRRCADRQAFEVAIDRTLRQADIEMVCLAGFMRILSPWFVERWWNKLMNIHPSLLPAFKGLDTHERALATGVRVHGCTVHLVRPALDNGPILVQGVVPVRQDDTEDTLAERVLAIEHQCYPLALQFMASGKATIEGDRVILKEEAAPLITWDSPDPQ